jgi:hypothetical protein
VIGCALALLVAGTGSAAAGMKPQKVTGKVELVNMGKHAFALTALNMQLIYVTAKTKFVGLKSIESIKKGQTLHVTVVHEGKRYNALTVAKM